MNATNPSPAEEQNAPPAFVVDDDPSIRTFVSNVLVGSGYKPKHFASHEAFAAGLAKLRPALVVLDLSLADSDAVEVLRTLDAAQFRGSVLLISGHAPATVAEVAAIGRRRGLSMLPALQKPFRILELRQRIELARGAPLEPATVTLESALRNNWLELWYQPKIHLASRTLAGAEALIRMRHPSIGVIEPARFLPEPGDPLYIPLTDFVVGQALSDWSLFASGQMVSRIAINVPASVLQRPEFVAKLRRNTPKDPRFPGLIVEITEDEAIRDPELAREIAVQLKLYNVHVSIDDFGSGYSSLSRMSELPFSEIKVDRSFVNGCSYDSAKLAMVKAVAELARHFAISSVAEGIELPEDLKVVSDLGYQMGQGYIFAKPMPTPDFMRLIASRSTRRVS